MAYDPMQGFQIGQAVGKAKGSAYGKTAQHMSDLEMERDKAKTKTSPLELLAYKNMFPSEKDQSVIDMNNAITASFSGKSDTSDISSVASQSGYSEDDYILKPVVTRFKGQTRVENVPELKPPLDAKSTNEIGAFRSTRNNLKNNLNLMNQNVKKYMNPLDPRSGRSGIGNFALKTQSFAGDKSANDFLTFKAETDKVFQEFRKATTGAQAALKELGWLEPDYPSPSDPPDLYTQKANEAMRRLEEGESLLLDLYSKRGFRVGEIRKGSNPLQQAALNQSQSSDPRELYNQFREQGLSKEEAKAKAGLK